MAPAGTSPAVIDKLNGEMVRILRSPEISNKMQAQGGEVAAGRPGEFADFLQAEVAKWNKVLKASNAQID